ncbi:hypothetical protein K2P47_03800 [Patescibacteria group bacterium]|nr:hypothetical protein [Patescibacteria group bacterium]
MMSSPEEDFSRALKSGSWTSLLGKYEHDQILGWIMDDSFCTDAKRRPSEESLAKLLKGMNLERLSYLFVCYKPEPLLLFDWYHNVTGIACDVLVRKFARLSASFRVSIFRKKCFENYKDNSPQKSSQAILLQYLAENMWWPALVRPVFRLVTGLQLGQDSVANAEDIVDSYRHLCHYLSPAV